MHVEGPTGRLVARTADGPAAVGTVIAALQAAGVRHGAVGVSRPTLDDVYLRARRPLVDVGRRRREGGRPMSTLTVTRPVAAPTRAWVTQTARSPAAGPSTRIRQPWGLGVAIIQPVIWLVLFGNVFSSVGDRAGIRVRRLHDVPGARASS